uniref:Ubiquitin-like protein ATG12 n=1 Tax=Marmota marmota marmota TaxID=9994 RepID=A0A8C6EMA1_MARMA
MLRIEPFSTEFFFLRERERERERERGRIFLNIYFLVFGWHNIFALYVVLRIEPGPHTCQASALPLEPHPQPHRNDLRMSPQIQPLQRPLLLLQSCQGEEAVGHPYNENKIWVVERTRTIQGFIDFIKKFLKLVALEQLFTYGNQFFAPPPDEGCLGSDGKLVLQYCKSQAWG